MYHASLRHSDQTKWCRYGRKFEVSVMASITPQTWLAFMVVNAIVWPGFSLAWWYFVQREEESMMEAMAETAEERTAATEG